MMSAELTTLLVGWKFNLINYQLLGQIVLSTAAQGERGAQWTSVIENPGKTFEMWHKLETD
jgi:hypothetical protein